MTVGIELDHAERDLLAVNDAAVHTARDPLEVERGETGECVHAGEPSLRTQRPWRSCRCRLPASPTPARWSRRPRPRNGTRLCVGATTDAEPDPRWCRPRGSRAWPAASSACGNDNRLAERQRLATLRPG